MVWFTGFVATMVIFSDFKSRFFSYLLNTDYGSPVDFQRNMQPKYREFIYKNKSKIVFKHLAWLHSGSSQVQKFLKKKIQLAKEALLPSWVFIHKKTCLENFLIILTIIASVVISSISICWDTIMNNICTTINFKSTQLIP